MSDMGEYFKALREHTRQLRAERRSSGRTEILALRDAGHRVVEMASGYQFRIDGGLDLYPTNRRYHHLNTGARGRYTTPQQVIDRFQRRTRG